MNKKFKHYCKKLKGCRISKKKVRPNLHKFNQ